jgi:mRNA interferase HigB
MTLLGKGVLDAFTTKHTDAKGWIENWIADVEGSLWQVPQDIKNKYSSASFIGNNVVIFNVKGNNYRLETRISYKISIVTALWAGTHNEYDQRNKGR